LLLSRRLDDLRLNTHEELEVRIEQSLGILEQAIEIVATQDG